MCFVVSSGGHASPPDEEEDEEDQDMCGLCDPIEEGCHLGCQEAECRRVPRVRVADEEVHTETCPYKLVQCGACEQIMTELEMQAHDCEVYDRPMSIIDLERVDEGNRETCQCGRREKIIKDKEGHAVKQICLAIRAGSCSISMGAFSVLLHVSSCRGLCIDFDNGAQGERVSIGRPRSCFVRCVPLNLFVLWIKRFGYGYFAASCQFMWK